MSVLEIAQCGTTFRPRRVAPRAWSRWLLDGSERVETCPSWCTDSHVNDTFGAVDDLQHGASLPGVDVPVSDWQGGTVPLPLLAPRIAVDPYSDDPARQVPHLLIEVAEDQFTTALDPTGALAAIGTVREHLDELERIVLGQLAPARAEV